MKKDWLDSEQRRLVRLLSEYSGEPAKVVSPGPRTAADLLVRTNSHDFFVVARASASAGPLRHATETLPEHSDDGAQTLLIVVPHMGTTGSAMLDEMGISWLDLSGNARISAPGLHIDVRGRPNRYAKRGRPANLYAPKARRIVRCLLIDPRAWLTQRSLAHDSGLGEGYVSRLVRRLEAEQLIDRNDAGAVRPRDADLLLEEWRRHDDFSKNQIDKGQLPRKTGEERLHALANLFSSTHRRYAATGLAAAWLLAPHANFRLTTVYVDELPADDELASLGWRANPRAPDTWLVVPRDEGVFHGSRVVDGVACVHPLQAYVDLAAQPERANEAAEELKARHLDACEN